MTDPDQSQPPSPDLDAIAAQTQPAALALLKPPALKTLQADLRAMKENAADEPTRKTLAMAVQRIAAEKRRRKDDAAEAPGAQAGHQRVKQAEQAEKRRAREQERAERKAARQAVRVAGKQTAGTGDKPAADKGKGQDQKPQQETPTDGGQRAKAE